jgi:hypothetical protein
MAAVSRIFARQTAGRQWDFDALRGEFEELIALDAPIEVTGFAWDEIDTILMEEDVSALEKGPLAPDPGAVATGRVGDVFRMGITA